MNKRYLPLGPVGMIIVIGFILLATMLQGCEPLRKKFTRQKASEVAQKESDPILDPIDYPEKIYNPEEDYAYRLSLLRVWGKELLSGIDDRVSAKRLQYFLSSIVVQLEEMNKIIAGEKKLGLTKAIQGFNAIAQTLDQPEQFYSLREIRAEADRLIRTVLNNYKLSLVSDSFQQ